MTVPRFLRALAPAALAAVLAPTLVATLPAAPARGDEAIPFAADALLPKKETGADRFLADHPKYDGRGIVVAIYDTGVDPGAPGLQVTTDGQPKIVDIVDGSGSGDVDTSTKRELGDDGTIEGLSGRPLKPAKAWKNPTGEWRVGIKPAYEIFPRGLVRRMKEERGEDFAEAQRAAEQAARRAMAEWDAAHPKPARAELEEREDLAARLERLETMGGNADDPGPVFDCVVFHDGKTWRAAIDTDEDGEFDDETTLTNYRDERKHATFGDRDLLNYVLNIYEDGDLLSIVADAGAHGTHVAGIVAAHYPDDPERNGVAPGAQLVSVKIGDTRLGSTSVGTGDVRGFVATLENGASLVNMSYGGATRLVNDGRIEELRAELVNEHGVIYVATAGNSGPALSSIGGPGGTSTATLSVGATVSPDMMAQQYSTRDTFGELNYQWSSRGPAADGWLGVDFSGPGAAIAPVPNWELQGSMLMNGTSMAAPNVCGGLALLLSGLKERDLDWTPHVVRRAVAATARPLEGTEVWAQGAGVVQIDRAWDLLTRTVQRADAPVRYEVSIPARRGARGLYLREPFENDRVFEQNIQVDPVFPKDHATREQVAFEVRMALEPTADWIDVPEGVLLMHGGRTFQARVDPTALPAGEHFAEIRGFDADDPGAGPLFSVPVTVLRTIDPTADGDREWSEAMSLEPGRVERRFFAVPEGGTWVDVTLRRRGGDTARTVILHAVQMLDGESFADHGDEIWVSLEPGEERIFAVPVVGGRTLELAFAQNWRSLGDTDLECEAVFRGLRPDADRIALRDGAPVTAVDVVATVGRETLEPEAELTGLRKALAATKRTIRPLDSTRDRLWDGRQVHELVAEYAFDVEEAGTWAVRPGYAMSDDVEDEYESGIWMVLDEAGQRVATGVGAEWRPAKLGKGTHRILLHVRHDDPEMLEAAGKLPLLVERDLGGMKLSVLDHPAGASAGGHRFGRREIEAGERARMYVAAPSVDDYPADAAGGDVLVGRMHFGREDEAMPGAGRRPGGWPLSLVVSPKPEKEKDPEPADDEPEDERTPAEKLAEAIRDEKIAALGEFGEDDDDAFRELAAGIEAEWPDHLPLWTARLERVDDEEGEGDLDDILAAADAVIARIDTTALAAHFGTDVDADDPAAKKERKEQEEVRDALRDALFRKARALDVAAGEKPDDGDRAAAAEAAWKTLGRWADLDSDDYADLKLARERRMGRLGIALKLVDDRIDDAEKPDRELHDTRLELLEALGWDHWVEAERRQLVLEFPPGDPVF